MSAHASSTVTTPRNFASGPVWRYAHLALALPFLLSGLTKTFDFAGATAEVAALTGLEPAAVGAFAVIAVQLGGSVLLLLGGRATRLGAVLLIAFTAAATLIAHAWWTKLGIDRVRDFNAFWEHVAIIGGLALAAAAAGGSCPRPVE
jgi:uncharacterized membrane protein YphA (DoxX/SURF4 family)